MILEFIRSILDLDAVVVVLSSRRCCEMISWYTGSVEKIHVYMHFSCSLGGLSKVLMEKLTSL